MKKKSHYSKPTQAPPPEKTISNFASFTKSFFSIFTEKEKKELQIYNEIKCRDIDK